MYIKEDRAEVTLGNLIKITPNLLLDLSSITLGRIKMFVKLIFLCLQNMVSGYYFRSWPMSRSWGWLGAGKVDVLFLLA